MKFLIQTMNGEVRHDFSFELIKAIEYNNWIKGNDYMSFILTPSARVKDTNLIPVGSVEFVIDFLDFNFKKITNPINIPIELRDIKFTGRTTCNLWKSELVGMFEHPGQCDLFIKSNTKIKTGFTGIVNSSNISSIPEDYYQTSSVIDIESEWRGFVHNGKLIDIKCYSGDPFTFPDIPTVNEMVSAYTKAPVSYTIDVAVLDQGETVIVECHDFFSCGFYGFNNYRKIPIMFSQWYNEFKRNAVN